ncbi:MAG: hypothetical protein VW891_15695, partial [Novosphingobium sp.]
TAEDLERSLSHSKLHSRKLEARIDEMLYERGRLELVIEQQQNVKQVHEVEARRQWRQRVGLLCTIAVASLKHAQRVRKLEERCANDRRAKVQALARGDDVKQDLLETTERLKAAEARVAELREAQASNASKTAETMTEPMQESEETIRLQVDFAKLVTALEERGVKLEDVLPRR